MRGISLIRKIAGSLFAFVALVVAQSAVNNFCFIFFQDKVPEKVKAIKKVS